jgi:hypothetical protein
LTGQQALSILQSGAIKEFRKKFGDDVPILVEGRVGILKAKDKEGNETPIAYIKKLKDAGALGAIVGGGLTPDAVGTSLLENVL